MRDVVLVAVAACCAYVVQGYNQGTYNGALLFIRDEFFPDDDALEGLVTAMLLYGTTAGVLVSLSFLGRRIPLIIAAALFAAAGAVLWWSPTVEVLITARFVTGFAAGVNTVNVPLFVSECAPPAIRGYLVSLSYTMLVVGILLSYLVNFALSLSSADDWRLMLGIVSVLAVVVLAMLPFLPESPRFLVRRRRYAEARRVLVRLRATADVDDELLTIVRGVFGDVEPGINGTPTLIDGEDPPRDKLGSDSKSSSLLASTSHEQTPLLAGPPPQQHAGAAGDWLASAKMLLFDAVARRAMLICVMLEFFQQFTGSQAVTFYTATILKDSGIEALFQLLGLSSNSSALLGSIIIYVTQMPFMSLGSRWLDVIGRRLMLLVTIPPLLLALLVIGVSYSLPDANVAGAWLAFGGLILFKCAYSPGLGPVPPVIESEIFPVPVRAVGLTTAATFGAVFNIIIVQTFPSMQVGLGAATPFFLFAGLSLVAELFIYLFIPETKLTVIEDTHRVLEKDRSSVAALP